MIEKQRTIDSVSNDRLKPAYLDHEPPHVLLDRLPDKTFTESTGKNEKSRRVDGHNRLARLFLFPG